MIKIKQLAIFMNDTNALLMELYNHMIVSRNIVFKSKENEEYIEYGNFLPALGADKHLHAYYNEISDIISNYQQVVLFGPVDVKNELFKLLKNDPHFRKIKIEFITTNEMSDFQIHEFALDYYK